MNRTDYDSRVNDIVGDSTKYTLVNRDPTNRLQTINNDLVEELFKRKIVTTNEKLKLKTTIALAPRLYGLPKIHKENFPLRPICSFVNSPSYELCKYLTNILRNITANSKYNVKDSLQFKDRIKDQTISVEERLISLDVVSLFPSIPVDFAIQTIVEKWEIIKEHTKMGKTLFLRILKFCIKDNRYFQNSGNVYIQKEGLPMGSPASPVIADIVMEKLLEISIPRLNVEPRLMTKYVDDLFCIVPEMEIDNILRTFNEFNPNIKFTIERECNSQLSYLDTMLKRRNDKLAIDWYQKPTASGRLINYYSKHSKNVIINTAKNLISRILTISDKEFHNKNKTKIRNILENNSFPGNLINKLIGQYRNREQIITRNSTEPRIYKSMTYIQGITDRLAKSKVFDSGKYKLAYSTHNTLNRLFSKTKDRIEKWDMSNVVYKIPCKGNNSDICDKMYIGTTKNKLKTRIAGHKSDQKYRHINSQKTALSSHCSELNHYPDFENVSILNTENNTRKRYILEMLEIIKTPISQRINYKTDTENVAQNYRFLVNN